MSQEPRSHDIKIKNPKHGFFIYPENICRMNIAPIFVIKEQDAKLNLWAHSR